MNRFAPLRALGSITASVLVVLGSLTALTVAGPAAPAQAAAKFDCGLIYSIQGTGDRNVRQVNTDTGQMTPSGAFNISGSGSLNGLGLSLDGTKAYGVLPDNPRSIYMYDRLAGANGTTTRLGTGASNTPVTHGAINPQNGNYYYGGFNGGTVEIYGFNTTTNTSMGLVASGTIPTGGGNGDWAFDQQGNLYVIGGVAGNNVVSVIDQKLPATGSITVTGTLITSIKDANGAINGIAFAGDGFLYLSSGTTLFKVNPSTGDVDSQKALTPSNSGSVDLASCASPNTIKGQKDFPNGRVSPDDQATVKITGGGITQGNSGTTTGNDSGLQDQPGEYAGPVFGLTGETYTVTETAAAGGSPFVAPGYVTKWTCVDQNKNNFVLGSGEGTTGSFKMPPGGTTGVAALCTFTNAAQIPGIELDKVAGAATGSSVGDKITYTFKVTNKGNVPLKTVTVADPKVGPITCPTSELAAGASTSCTSATYTLKQEDINAGKVDNTATATGTPTTPGLPTVKDDDSTTTPITQTPKLVLDKKAATPVDVNNSGLTDAGDTIAYTFTVKNAGNLPITNLKIVDPTVGATTCVPTNLPVGGSSTCTTVAPYTITDADETAGKVVNVARAEGNRPNGAVVKSNDDSTTTPVQKPAPKLAIKKTAGTPVDVNGSGITDAGDTIAYTFTVTNTGNVPLKNLVVNDPKAGAVTCASTTLAVNVSTLCEATNLYKITKADEEAGKVINTAIASGTTPAGGNVDSPPDSTTTPTELSEPKLSIDKVAGKPFDANNSGLTDAGDTIQYTFTVKNTGNVPVSSVSVNDPTVGAVTCDDTALAPGEDTECAADAVYTISKDDVENGTIENTAFAEGVDPDKKDVVSDPDSTVTPVDKQAGALELDKKAGDPVDVNNSGLTDAGDTILYSFTLTNSGNVPLSNLTISDTLAGPVTCKATTLKPTESTTCVANAPYVVKAADEKTGNVVNVANANGKGPDGDDTPSNEDTTTTPVQQPNPELSIDKAAGTPVDVNKSGITDAGDTISYTFLVTNTGNVPLKNVTVADPKVGTVTCPKVNLAPGEATLCTAAPYVVTKTDETSGSVLNVATATAKDPNDKPVDPADDTTTTPTATPNPKLTILKKAGTPVDVNNSGLTDAGDTIQYTFTVTNAGNVPLTDVTVTDDIAGAVTCKETDLAVGATTECKADKVYVVTKADENAGNVHNVATAKGEDPDGEPTDPSDPGETDTPTTKPVVKLVIDKTAGKPVDVNKSGITDAGDTIQFSFIVTNTGNVPVLSIAVVDPIAGAVTCKATMLAPDASTECEADKPYVVTSADEKTGSVDNIANATGVDPNGDPTKSNDDDTTTPTQTPAPELSIAKKAGTPVDVNESGLTDAGDTIAFTFTVTNIGNVPLKNVTVSDPKAGAVTCEATTLAVDASTECKADELYVVTPADELAGAVRNVATAKGEDPDGEPTDPSEPGKTETPTTVPAPELGLVKKAGTPVDVNESGITDAGDTIAFTFTVTNIGNVPLKSVTVSDPKVGAVTCEATTLAVDASTECTADKVYTITKADEADEIVRNTAKADGVDPDGDDVVSNPDSTNTPVTQQAPALTLDKMAGVPVDVNKSGLTDAGDTIAYTFKVTNNGNIPLFDVKVNDPIAGSVTCPPGRLAKGASVECAADELYVVTKADESAGKVVNVAVANATDPDKDEVESNEDTTTTPTTKPNPGLLIDKEAGAPVDDNNNGVTDAGDTITYTFTVTNNGNVPLSNVAVEDPMLGDKAVCTITRLLPGASITCSAKYVLTQANVDAGQVKNTAIATGEDPDENPVDPPEDSTETPIKSAPKLDLVKKATLDDKDGDNRADVGETIQWSFTLTNTGNVTINDIKVNDPLAGDVTCEVTELAPGDSIVCSADKVYTVTQADVDAGKVYNVATATGMPPKGEEPVDTPESETTTPTDSRPAMLIEKSSKLKDKDGDDLADEGEVIRYTFKVTNTGTVSINKLAIEDKMLADAGVKITCKATDLAPGASTNCIATDYTVTKDDVENKKIVNVAAANGCAPGSEDEDCTPVVSNEDDTTTPADTDRDVLPDDENPKDPTGPNTPDGPKDVSPDNGLLPNAGGPMMAALWAGLLLLLGGTGTMLWSRRRRT